MMYHQIIVLTVILNWSINIDIENIVILFVKKIFLLDIENYKILCKFDFNLNDYPNEFEFTLIEKYGWYKAKNHGDNLNGISRDHMYSIMEGYKSNIDPKIISHPANCKLMIHNENVSKYNKCSITIEELIDRINKWDNKYKLKNKENKNYESV